MHVHVTETQSKQQAENKTKEKKRSNKISLLDNLIPHVLVLLAFIMQRTMLFRTLHHMGWGGGEMTRNRSEQFFSRNHSSKSSHIFSQLEIVGTLYSCHNIYDRFEWSRTRSMQIFRLLIIKYPRDELIY